jgi:hypothetical protein
MNVFLLMECHHSGIPGNVNILKWLLNRNPTTWDDLIAKEV